MKGKRYSYYKIYHQYSFNERVEAHGPDVARKGMEIYEYLKFAQEAFGSPHLCKIPVIAAVNGYCFGAGVDLTSACDIRLASSDAKMSIREVEIGTVADFGTLQRFKEKCGSASWFRELAYAHIFTTFCVYIATHQEFLHLKKLKSMGLFQRYDLFIY